MMKNRKQRKQEAIQFEQEAVRLSSVSDAEIDKHRKRQQSRTEANDKLREDGVSFFNALQSPDADYVANGVISRNDLLKAQHETEETA